MLSVTCTWEIEHFNSQFTGNQTKLPQDQTLKMKEWRNLLIESPI